MAQVVKPDVEYPLPEDTIEKHGLRDGGPSMEVPGDGKVRAAAELPGDRGERSAAHHADAMSSVGGAATPHDRKK
jgi:hypothetical protein